MRPLVVSLLPRPPHPARDGSAIRNFHLLRALATEFRVRAFALVPPDARDLPWAFPAEVDGDLIELPRGPVHGIGTLARAAAGTPYTVAKYRSAELEARVAQAASQDRPTWVITHGFHLARLAVSSTPPAWLDLHNVESLIWRRQRLAAESAALRAALGWQGRLVRRMEADVVRHADGLSVVSELDARLVEDLGPRRPPLLVPNGVDLERYVAPAPEPSGFTLLFVGDLRWAPNAHGIAWFRQSVWPHLRERVPDVRVQILGRGAGPELTAMADERFEFLGDEADTRPAWSRAAVGIVPLHSGGGTRLKILEAAAMGVPVISTSIGAEGLDLEGDAAIIIRDEPREWVESIVRLRDQPELRSAIALRARARVEASYDWRRIGESFVRHLAATAASRQ